VVRADLHVTSWHSVAQSARTDAHGTKVVSTSNFMPVQCTRSQPANFLNTVITCNNTISDLKVFYVDLTSGGRNACSGSETGDNRNDVLDVTKLEHVPDLIAI